MPTTHSPDLRNVECIGERNEWVSKEVFDTEDQAMNFYKSSIRPGMEKLMRGKLETIKAR